MVQVLASLLGRLKGKVCYLCIVALISLAPSVSAAETRNIFGVVGHFLHNSTFFDQYSQHWNVNRTLPVVKELGVGLVHEGLYAFTNPDRMLVTAGSSDPVVVAKVRRHRRIVSDWLAKYDAAGIRVVLAILTVLPSDENAKEINAEFAEWVAELAASHASIVAVQMHNEPNLRHFWKATPEEYVDTYRPYAEQIRKARPDVEIIVGSMSALSWPSALSWFRRAANYGLLDFADAVAVHPYNTTSPPEADPHFLKADPKDPENLEKAVRAFWQTVQDANKDKRPLKLYFTEFGYNTAQKGLAAIGSEAKQAAYLARLSFIYQDLRLRGLPLEAAFWYDLKDDGEKADNEQHHFGLVSYDLSRRKPAFRTYQNIVRFFSDIDDLEAVDVKVTAADNPAALKTKTWRRKSDGATIVAFWRLDQVEQVPDDFKAQLRIELSAQDAIDSATQHSAGSNASQTVSVTSKDGVVTVPVTVSALPGWLVLSP